MTMTPEPKGMLDTMTTQTLVNAADGAGVVNGPEDDLWDWHAVDWRAVEEDVRRLRQRIFTASKAGDLKRVRSLQKLMLRSRANTLVSVRRVTELNAGRETAGVDGKVVLLSQVKAELVDWVQGRSASWKAKACQAGVHSQGRQQEEATPARNSRCGRPGASGPGGQCAGTRVGGAV